jgi:hypothetical protein
MLVHFNAEISWGDFIYLASSSNNQVRAGHYPLILIFYDLLLHMAAFLLGDLLHAKPIRPLSVFIPIFYFWFSLFFMFSMAHGTKKAKPNTHPLSTLWDTSNICTFFFSLFFFFSLLFVFMMECKGLPQCPRECINHICYLYSQIKHLHKERAHMKDIT